MARPSPRAGPRRVIKTLSVDVPPARAAATYDVLGGRQPGRPSEPGQYRFSVAAGASPPPTARPAQLPPCRGAADVHSRHRVSPPVPLLGRPARGQVSEAGARSRLGRSWSSPSSGSVSAWAWAGGGAVGRNDPGPLGATSRPRARRWLSLAACVAVTLTILRACDYGGRSPQASSSMSARPARRTATGFTLTD